MSGAAPITASLPVGAILARLAAEVTPEARVLDARVGLFWTVVQTDAGTGLARTATEELRDEHGLAVEAAGTIVGRRVGDVLSRGLVGGPAERALALAALNAGLPAPPPELSGENGADLLSRLAPGRRIAVVGHFPFVERLRAVAAVDVFELPGNLRPGDRPSSELPDALPMADLVAITGTTLLTRTLEPILAACRPDAWRLLIGPSTPLHPLLFEVGLDALSGLVVADPAAALRGAGEGATLRQLRGIRKVTWHRSGAAEEGR